MTATESNQVIRNKNSVVQLIEGDIVYALYLRGVVCEVSDFKETFAAYNKLADGRSLKIISEFEKFATATPEARQYAENIDLVATAEAIVFQGLALKILVRFFLMFRKQPHPIKVFNDKESALEWLRSV